MLKIFCSEILHQQLSPAYAVIKSDYELFPAYKRMGLCTFSHRAQSLTAIFIFARGAHHWHIILFIYPAVSSEFFCNKKDYPIFLGLALFSINIRIL